jgi:hypothetical protein
VDVCLELSNEPLAARAGVQRALKRSYSKGMCAPNARPFGQHQAGRFAPTFFLLYFCNLMDSKEIQNT